MSSTIMSKLNKISSYLSSFQAESDAVERRSSIGSTSEIDGDNSQNSQQDRINLSSTENDESFNTNAYSSIGNNIRNYYSMNKGSDQEDLTSFGGRLHTFAEKGWVSPVSNITVYDIVKRGWYLHKQLLLRCSSCYEILSAKLPDDFTCKGYIRAVNLLKERVVTKHRQTCQFSSISSHESLCKPPRILSPSHFFVISDAASVLITHFGGEKIPYFDFTALLNKMDLERSQLTEIWGTLCNDLEVTALMLILTGWKKSPSVNAIRCDLCKRDVALKTFVNHDEYLQVKSQHDKEQEKRLNEESEEKEKGQEMTAEENKESAESSVEEKNENNKRARPDSDAENDEIKRTKLESDEISFSKPIFCPLSQHRYWCAWVNNIEGDTESKGFNVFSKEIKSTLQLTSVNSRFNSPKYSSNIEGLRSIRNLLNSWTK